VGLDPVGAGPQRGGIGVEAEHDAAAALFYERRKPVGEMLRHTPGGVGDAV
jgi:hypothetical protein